MSISLARTIKVTKVEQSHLIGYLLIMWSAYPQAIDRNTLLSHKNSRLTLVSCAPSSAGMMLLWKMSLYVLSLQQYDCGAGGMVARRLYHPTGWRLNIIWWKITMCWQAQNQSHACIQNARKRLRR